MGKSDTAIRDGYLFFASPDAELLGQSVESSLSAAAQGLERHVYWGDEDPPPLFWSQLCQENLFGARRLLLVRQANLWSQAIWKRIGAALGQMSGQCIAAFCLEGPFEKGRPKIPAYLAKSPFFASARKAGRVIVRPPLGPNELRRHVQARASALGLEFDPGALAVFCSSIPPDARTIENELQKFTLAGQSRIGPEIAALNPWQPEGNIFTLIKCILAGNLAGAWQEAGRSVDRERLLFGLLSLLARELKKLWQADAPRPGRHALCEGLDLLAMLEYRVKDGELSTDQALDTLIFEMCPIFSRNTAA